MVWHFCVIWNFLSSSNGCKLMNYAHRFAKLRNYLCFYLEKIFCSTERTFSPTQTQNAPEKDGNLRLLCQ